MNDNGEWQDITNEVILDTVIGDEDGKIIVPKWPGIGNLRVLRRKEKEPQPQDILSVGDAIKYYDHDYDGIREGVVVNLNYNSTADFVFVVDYAGDRATIQLTQVTEIWRNGDCIYHNASTTANDTPASSENSD